MLDYRMESILSYLQTNEYATGDELGRLIEVSSKTVSACIKDLNDIIMQHGAEIKAIRAKGYSLSINDLAAFEIFESRIIEMHEQHIPNTTAERLFYITRRFLFGEPVELNEMCNYLLITKREFQRLIKTLQEDYRPFDIEITCKNNVFEIKGNSYDERSLWNKTMCTKGFLLHLREKRVVDAYEYFRKVLNDAIKGRNIYFRRSMELSTLMIITATVIRCIDHKGYDDGSITYYTENCKPEFIEVAQEICQRIHESYNVDFPEIEVKYIAQQIMCRCEYGTYTFLTDKKYPERVVEIANSIINNITGKKSPAMTQAYYLTDYLTGLLIRNENKVCPMFDIVAHGDMQDYFVEASRKIICSELLPEIRFKEDEIRLLAGIMSSFETIYNDCLSF